LTDQHLAANCADKPTALEIRRAASAEDRGACMRIRMEVFVDEQRVSPEEEIDGLDDICMHYIAFSGSGPVATARVIPKGSTAKVGRVAVLRAMRGLRIGFDLMRFVLRDCASEGFTEAALDSQTYAIPFYERLGFAAEGDEFLDAGIPHYRMRRSLEHRDTTL
jgi:predicted GNAT family N-acyltransferase